MTKIKMTVSCAGVSLGSFFGVINYLSADEKDPDELLSLVRETRSNIVIRALKGTVPATLEAKLMVIEDLIEIAEKSGSAPVYALLKRTDERFVTMQAYDNPVFVEDVVRNAAALLRADSRVSSFTVKAVNHESIHDHNAFATIISG